VGGNNALYQVKGKRLKELYKVAVAINCMHGERGEDGSIIGVFTMSKIPVASPSLMPSSVCIDKRFTKIFLKGANINCLDSVYAEREDDLKIAVEKFGFPMIIKPNKLGSSIGISTAENESELKAAFGLAKRYGEGVLIEPKLEEFTEINCAAYLSYRGMIISECEEPVGKGKVLSFGDKYEDGKRIFPANIPKQLTNKIKKTTEKIYRALGADGIIRIDYFLVKNKVFVNEINTVPGSLSCYLFGDTMKNFTKILTEIITTAEIKFAKSLSVKKTYATNILSGVGAKGVKRL
jgi:D-alanine-D-alanine ligase